MKRAKKTALLSMVDTMMEVAGEVNNMITSARSGAVANLLADLQDTAVFLGETIEGEQGQGTETVALLEALCEEAFKVSNEMNYENKLISTLERIKSTLGKEIKAPATVVFLPMDGKMWDGFESLWKRECANPDNKVVVIPLPWYEKNVDGEITDLHYSLDGYPPEVALTGYNDFLIAQKHPDVVYIQNISNGADMGKTVHSAFYTGEIKKNTDELIYVPYDIEGACDMMDGGFMARLSEKALQPGIYDATTVLVQSKELKKSLMSILASQVEEDVESREYWDGVLKVACHPRLLRIIDARDEREARNNHGKNTDSIRDLARYAIRADGSRKKVLLYAISAWKLMLDGSEMIDKIMDSFKVFADNKDNLAVIFRPFPETKEILQIFDNNCVSKYDDLISFYKESGIGIIDESKDFLEAVLAGDAYYGDDCGFAYMFAQMGKPVMIQNLQIRSN